MKRNLFIAALLGALLLMPGAAPLQAAQYHIVVQPMESDSAPEILDPGVAPFVQDGRLLVPLRSLAEALGFELELNSATGEISMQGVGRQVKLSIGSSQATVNGSPVTLEVPAQVVDNRTLVPLRFIGEALNYQVYFTNHINNEGTAYILPYDVIPTSEITGLFDKKDQLFKNYPYPEAPGYFTLYLPEGFKTPLGVSLGQTIGQVLNVYGIPESPKRKLEAYTADYNGTLQYPGPFTPRSGDYSKVELTFENGVLIQYKLVPPAD